MKNITVTDSANGDGSLYIADGTRGGNIPKSWADAIFQHKLSEIGLYWVEKEKTFVVTESLVWLDGERLHQEITAPTCGGAAWTCINFSNISESEAVKMYYGTLPQEPKYGETWRILISQESSWIEAKVAEIGELTVFVYTDPNTGLPAVCSTDSVHSTNRFKLMEIKPSITL